MKSLDQLVIDDLNEIGQAIGSDLLGELIKKFSELFPIAFNKLGGAVLLGDFGNAQRSAHILKSSAGGIGALPFSRLCGELESQARGKNVVAMKKLFSELELEAPNMLEELIRIQSIRKKVA